MGVGGQKAKVGLIGPLPRRGDGLQAFKKAGAAMGREGREETRALLGGETESALGGRRGRMVREMMVVERESLGVGGRGVSRAVGGGLSKEKGALQVQWEGPGGGGMTIVESGRQGVHGLPLDSDRKGLSRV